LTGPLSHTKRSIITEDSGRDPPPHTWKELLDGPLDRLFDVLVSASPQAVNLRQNSPFAGVLTVRERFLIRSGLFTEHEIASLPPVGTGQRH
jgi:hypothetical protein